MASVRGPHIPYKEWAAGETPNPVHDQMNWLEVERWAARLSEQISTGGESGPWIYREYGDFTLEVGDSSSYITLTPDGNYRFYFAGLTGGSVYMGGTPDPADYYAYTDAFPVTITAEGTYQVHVRCEILLPGTHNAMWMTGYAYNNASKWGLDSQSIPTEGVTPLLVQPCFFSTTFVTRAVDTYDIMFWEWLQAPIDYTMKVRNASLHIVRLDDATPDLLAT